MRELGRLRRQNPHGHRAYSRGGTSTLSNQVYFHTLILSGEYEQLFDLSRGNGPLGWSEGNNPKPFLVLFLLFLLSRGSAQLKILTKQWGHLINGNSDRTERGLWARYNLMMDRVYGDLKLGEEQQKTYLDWCLRQIDLRVNAIVSNHHRTSYSKAADLVVAAAEVLAHLDKRPDAIALIEGYHKKYNRFSALRKELRRAAQTAEIS